MIPKRFLLDLLSVVRAEEAHLRWIKKQLKPVRKMTSEEYECSIRWSRLQCRNLKSRKRKILCNIRKAENGLP